MSLRKSFDTFAVIGPWIVTADEIPDPQRLSIKLWRNDELKQDGDTLVAEVKQVGRLEVKVGSRPPSRTPRLKQLASP